VREQGADQWLTDTRGADGQGAPLEFDTGMGEVPEVGARPSSRCPPPCAVCRR
jgi:hypothetical protein